MKDIHLPERKKEAKKVGMTMTQKILAAHSGFDNVKQGQ